MITAQQLIDEARKLIGTPWKHQGRSSSGVDCIGLVLLAAKNAGLDILEAGNIRAPSTYPRNASPLLRSLVAQHCEQIGEPIAGCLLFFRFTGETFPRHFGIYTEAGTVIHADARTRRQVIEHGFRQHWPRWLDSAWLVPGVKT